GCGCGWGCGGDIGVVIGVLDSIGCSSWAMDRTLRLACLLRLGMYIAGMPNWFTLDLLEMLVIGLASIHCIA
ncbi:hypothetical protein, partial [Escherichia coli]|uniref:hypothetical protein n=1 Tax=Escherichia coli TaxID=562 RepID=UPI0019D66B3A